MPAFNVANLELAQAAVAAAEEAEAPVFLEVSEGAWAYGGVGLIGLLKALRREARVPVVLHLDHGASLAAAARAVGCGFSSIMVDGSRLSYPENVALVKAAVEAFGGAGVAVEAELGHVGGGDDPTSFTEPRAAAAFVAATGCDSLAVSVGTSHGAYKFDGPPALDLGRLEEIAAAAGVPLVLHGASGVYDEAVAKLAAAGGSLPGARGVPDDVLREAIRRGIAKVNVDTDLRIAFTAALRRYLGEDARVIDPKKYLGAARDAVREAALHKLRVCGAAGRAEIS